MKTQIQRQENVSRTIQSKTKAANQANVHSVLQKYAARSVQRQADNGLEEDMIQGKFETAQREGVEDEEPLQGKFSGTVQREESLPPKNETGIPDNMKAGFENLSGFSFDDVRVHYNSDKPAQLQALAYTQGNQVHIAPGQEKHLGHELGHVVQQKQGRVQPTMQLQGVSMNDDEGFEREADEMGEAVQYMGFDKGALAKVLVQMKASGEAVQKITADEAYRIAQEKADESWYRKIFIPTITTEIRKKGKTYKEYIRGLEESVFTQEILKLHSRFNNNFIEFAASEDRAKPKLIGPHPISISTSYPNCYNVLGTNILISKFFVGDSNLFDKYEELWKGFISSCLNSTFVCYRGISASHFSWDSIRTSGVVASEGSEDIPTFTVADASGEAKQTRWLPFTENINIALSAARVGASDTETGTLNGAVIRCKVGPDMPIAWLTSGEVSIRGPIVIETVNLVKDRNLEKVVNCRNLPPATPFGKDDTFESRLKQLVEDDHIDVFSMKSYNDINMTIIRSRMLTETEYEHRYIRIFKNEQDIIKSRREYFDSCISDLYTDIIEEGSEKSQYLSNILKSQNFQWCPLLTRSCP